MQDPTAQQMRDFLTTQACGDDMSFEIEEAIYWFAYDFHGGQWSNLYSALSTSDFHPGPYAFQPEDPFMYDMLVAEYAN